MIHTGFGKFFPKGGRKPQQSKKKSSTGKSEKSAGEGTKNSGPTGSKTNKKTGSGSGGGGPMGDFNSPGNLITVGLMLLLLSNMFGGDRKGQEISWQDFKNHLLESGQVWHVQLWCFLQKFCDCVLSIPGRSNFGCQQNNGPCCCEKLLHTNQPA